MRQSVRSSRLPFYGAIEQKYQLSFWNVCWALLVESSIALGHQRALREFTDDATWLARTLTVLPLLLLAPLLPPHSSAAPAAARGGDPLSTGGRLGLRAKPYRRSVRDMERLSALQEEQTINTAR